MLALTALVSLAFLTGCGGGGEQRKPVFVVTGKVTDAGGKPVAGAQVIFHPTIAGDTPKPNGKTDENGVFKLTTYDGNDGAPTGDYKVSVTLLKATTADGFPENKLPAKYGVPDQSGFTASVGTAPTEVPAFQIKK